MIVSIDYSGEVITEYKSRKELCEVENIPTGSIYGMLNKETWSYSHKNIRLKNEQNTYMSHPDYVDIQNDNVRSYDDEFFFDKCGNVYIKKNECFLKRGTTLDSNGYFSYQKKRKNMHIHRQMMIAWFPEIDIINKVVDHIDRNRQNNSIENLRIVDQSTNIENSNMREEQQKYASRISKKTYQYSKNIELIRVFDWTKQAWNATGVSSGNISWCANGKQKTAGGFIWSYKEL